MTVPLKVGNMLRSGRSHDHLAPDQPLENPAAADSALAQQQKIVYNFFSGIAPEIANPGGALPGANRWDDPLDADHPYPVILMHGTGGGGQTNWGTYVPLLFNDGYSVFTLTYGALKHRPWPINALGGMAPIEDSAAEFGEFVDKVLDRTGATQIDVVGHSQGTLVPNYYAKFLGGAPNIRKYISLSPLWEGTGAFGVGVLKQVDLRLGIDPLKILPCRAAAQMTKGSEFIEKLNSGGTPYVDGIEYTNISTRFDEFVRPYTSGQVEPLPGQSVTNIVVQENCGQDFSDHLGICGSPRAAQHVLNALDPKVAEQVPCSFVPPFFG